MKAIFSPSHCCHDMPYDGIVKELDLNIKPQSLRKAFARRFHARKFKKRRTTVISKKNKNSRVSYGWRHQKAKITLFWQYVYFTDEAHFNSKDLSFKTKYGLRQPGQQSASIQETYKDDALDVTVHVAAGISYNHKGIFRFYNDPDEPAISKSKKQPKPRRSKWETDQMWDERLKEYHATTGHPIDPKTYPLKETL
jgi:hypothetical protein